MTTTIRTSDPRDLLALIPYQLGFVPHESAVLISIRRGRSRVGLVARVDLPDLAHPEHGPQLARHLVSHLVEDGAATAVLVLWTHADTRDGSGAAQLARRHVDEAGEYFLGAIDCWVVGATGYREIDCADETCCPPSGHPLSDLQASAVSAEMVLRGERPARSREELVGVPAVDPRRRRAARRAAERWRQRGLHAPDDRALRQWRRGGLTLWRELTGAVAAAGTEGAAQSHADPYDGPSVAGPSCVLDAPALGRLRAALDDVLVRDAVLVSLVPGCADVAEALVDGDTGADVDRALEVIVDASRGAPPLDDVVHPARAVLTEVAAHSAGASHAPSLTLLAMIAWWSGDGARASVLVERALEAEPDHRLGHLVRETLEAAMPPGWVKARRAVEEGDPGAGAQDRTA